MPTRHRPSKNLQNILLANLLDRAESMPGEPACRRLSNNLQVDIKITENDRKTHLQISRSGRFPGVSEWRSVLRHWPARSRRSSNARLGAIYALSGRPGKDWCDIRNTENSKPMEFQGLLNYSFLETNAHSDIPVLCH